MMKEQEFLQHVGYRFAVSRNDGAEVFLRDDISTAKPSEKNLRTIVLGEKSKFDDFDNAVFLKAGQLKIGLRMRPDRTVVHKTEERVKENE